MYKKIVALAVVGVLGSTLSAQCPKKGQEQCSKRGGRGMMGRHHGGSKGHMMKMLFGKLNLSEEQKAQIQELTSSMRDSAEDTKEIYKELFETQRALIEADTFDEEAYRAALRKAAAIKEDIAVEHALIKRDIRAVLTAEQQEQMKQIITEKKEQWEKMKEQRGPKGKQCPKQAAE